MSWTKKQINQHKKTCDLLYKIISEIPAYIINNPNTSEIELQKYILARFKFYKLKKDRLMPIVAFGSNTSFVHYYPTISTNKILKPNNLILIDIWTRLDEKSAPFSDITWMLYYGKRIPAEINKLFKHVAKSRDLVIRSINENLKKKIILTGNEYDRVARSYLAKFGLDKLFIHGTGHPLGFANAHGRGVRLSPRGRGRLSPGIAYTIEPGIYFKDKYGFRTEIDFYISQDYELTITTSIQKNIIRI